MGIDEIWRDFFRRWPLELAQRGVVVTIQDEQVPFEGFLTHEHMLLLSRKTPDTSGARKYLVPYLHIASLKIVDVVSAKPFQSIGFSGSLKD